MNDFVIVAIIVVILVVATISIINKRKNKASCCGSASYVAKSKKLNHVECKKSFEVKDMECQNCVNKVMGAIQDLSGCSAMVDLKKKLVVVSMEEEIDDEIIMDAVRKKGYEIKRL